MIEFPHLKSLDIILGISYHQPRCTLLYVSSFLGEPTATPETDVMASRRLNTHCRARLFARLKSDVKFTVNFEVCALSIDDRIPSARSIPPVQRQSRSSVASEAALAIEGAQGRVAAMAETDCAHRRGTEHGTHSAC